MIKNGKDKKVKTIKYRLKCIDSCTFMKYSLSNLVDNLSGINNKEPKNKFTDSMRSMTDSLLQSFDEVSKIDREISKIDKKFIDNMRSMLFSLAQSINKISDIDRKISQINKKEPDNKFTDRRRSMLTLLSLSIDKVSEIDKKYLKLIKNLWMTWDLWYLHYHDLLIKYQRLIRKYHMLHCINWKVSEHISVI